MNIGEICTRAIVTAPRDMPVAEAAVLMRTHHAGSVIVVDATAANTVPLGIVTDRDIVVEVVAKKVDPGTVTVGDLMGSTLISAPETEDVYDALECMRNAGIRRMPVVGGNGALIGIITLDDLLEFVAEEIDKMVRLISREQFRETLTRKQ